MGHVQTTITNTMGHVQTTIRKLITWAKSHNRTSESEIDQFKENAVPQKTEDATKFRVKLFKGRLIKFIFCK